MRLRPWGGCRNVVERRGVGGAGGVAGVVGEVGHRHHTTNATTSGREWKPSVVRDIPSTEPCSLLHGDRATVGARALVPRSAEGEEQRASSLSRTESAVPVHPDDDHPEGLRPYPRCPPSTDRTCPPASLRAGGWVRGDPEMVGPRTRGTPLSLPGSQGYGGWNPRKAVLGRNGRSGASLTIEKFLTSGIRYTPRIRENSDTRKG